MNGWSEADSQAFLDKGDYFVPERETQLDLIVELLATDPPPARVLELGCGEGRLAARVLSRFPRAHLTALDGSPLMRERAAARLADDTARVRLSPFALENTDWRRPEAAFDAVISSLTLHHLFPDDQWRLYRDLHRMLAPGGVLVIADLIAPEGARALGVAAAGWDAAVRRQVEALDGVEDAYRAFVQGEYNIFRYPDPMDRPAPLRDHLNQLAAAGFVEVDVCWLRAGHAIFGGRKPLAAGVS